MSTDAQRSSSASLPIVRVGIIVVFFLMIFGGVAFASKVRSKLNTPSLTIVRTNEILTPDDSGVCDLVLLLQNSGKCPFTVLGVSRADCRPVTICEDPPFRLAGNQQKQIELRIARKTFEQLELPIVVFVDKPPYELKLNLTIKSRFASGTPNLAPELN